MTATESRHSSNPTSTMTDEAERTSGPDPFGPEVPTEEAGMVAMTGWTMAALAVGLAVVALLLITGVRRRRRRPEPSAAEIAQHAVSDLMERSRAESRAMRRRLAKRVARQIEAAA